MSKENQQYQDKNNVFFDVKVKIKYDNENQNAEIMSNEIVNDTEIDKAQKILQYLNEQLAICQEEMKSYSTIFGQSDESLRIDQIATQRMYYRIKAIVRSCERI